MKRRNSVFSVVALSVILLSACPGCFTGNHPDGTRAGRNDEETNGNQIANARRIIAEYAAKVECKEVEGLSGVPLPDVPPIVVCALDVLCFASKRDYEADIAAVLVRHAAANVKYGPGRFVQPKHPLVLDFLCSWRSQGRFPISGELSTSKITEWICRNRSKFGDSALLDKEITQYKAECRRYEEKWRKIVRDARNRNGDLNRPGPGTEGDSTNTKSTNSP